MVDAEFQPEVVQRVQKLVDLGYKINYQTWPPLKHNRLGLPLPSTHVWEGDYGGNRLEEAYGIVSTLKLLDEVIATLSDELCTCSAQDLLWRGCRC